MASLLVDIVPWVLPYEDIPISITWDNKDINDLVEVRMRKEIQIVEILNGKIDSEVIKDDYVIRVIIPSYIQNEAARGYVGIVVSYPQIPNEQLSRFDFMTRLIGRSELQNKSEILVFRPFLELREIKIIRNRLGLDLVHKGFGDIEIKVEGMIKGEVVTHSKTILRRTK